MFQLLDAGLFDRLFVVFSELQTYLERGIKFPSNNWVDILEPLENGLKDHSTETWGYWGKRDSSGIVTWGRMYFALSHESRIRAALKGSTKRYVCAVVRGLKDFWGSEKIEFPELRYRNRHWSVKIS